MVTKITPSSVVEGTPKILAFFLPQYHTIPENDAWWGEGFTEWTNVRKATPLFPGHFQPRVPADGRYYNLLDPSTQDWQASLAREHGLYGFCYYHYWFSGKRLLEKPIEMLLERGKPDFPFCLCWANEPWTRAWDGGESQVLMPQGYGDPSDWERHFEYLLRVFRDPRYIRVDGKPVFLIYRSTSIDTAEPMIALWRRLAEAAGLPGLHVVSMMTAFGTDTRPIFDAHTVFEPSYTFRQRLSFWWRKRERFYRKYRKWKLRLFGRSDGPVNSFDYGSVWRAIVAREIRPNVYPGAFLDWDNTPRRGLERGMVVRNFNASVFASCFRAKLLQAHEAGSPFLFVDAWNEWAEGTYLEPDEARGLFFLEAIRDAVAEVEARSGRVVVGATSHARQDANGNAVSGLDGS